MKTDWFTDHCPPHRFDTAWVNDEEGGVIYCRACGDIRSLKLEDR